MSINFDALPKDKPEGFGLPPQGFTLVTVTKPTVKTSGTGNEYLEIQLKTPTGQVVYDRIMVSDAPAIQYKLARFVAACKLPLVGEITFSDLGKVVDGKQIVADIVHKENEWQGKVTTKAEVDIFAHDVYYPMEEYATLVPDAPALDLAKESESPTTPGSY